MMETAAGIGDLKQIENKEKEKEIQYYKVS